MLLFAPFLLYSVSELNFVGCGQRQRLHATRNVACSRCPSNNIRTVTDSWRFFMHPVLLIVTNANRILSWKQNEWSILKQKSYISIFNFVYPPENRCAPWANHILRKIVPWRALISKTSDSSIIIIRNSYIAPNPTWQLKTGMDIRISTWNIHTPDDPRSTAKCRQTCTHPGTICAYKDRCNIGFSTETGPKRNDLLIRQNNCLSPGRSSRLPSAVSAKLVTSCTLCGFC